MHDLAEALALLGEFHGAMHAHEQAGAQMFFKHVDLAADGFAADQQFGGGLSYAAMARHGLESDEAVERGTALALRWHDADVTRVAPRCNGQRRQSDAIRRRTSTATVPSVPTRSGLMSSSTRSSAPVAKPAMASMASRQASRLPAGAPR
jgi:hypothetical protein